MSSILSAFKFHLGNTVLPRLVTVGRYDGINPSIVCATSSDHLLLHSPHTRSASNENETRTIQINRTISALASGDFEAGARRGSAGSSKNNAASSSSSSSTSSSSPPHRDLLLIGSSTSLQSYDIETNSDIFFREVPDGVNSLTFGQMAHLPGVPLAMVGGNCSLQGFNSTGQESFWTVTGDNVSALTFRDTTPLATSSTTAANTKASTAASSTSSSSSSDPSKSELIVGTEDFEIRIFRGEEVVHEVTESDVITNLQALHGNYFAYSLANGTIGVYQNTTRVWSIKSKHTAVSLAAYDMNADGVPELIVGWSNGRIEVRNDQTGNVLYKDKMSSSIAKLLTYDYRSDGKESLIAVSVDGEVRGYGQIELESASGGDAGISSLASTNTSNVNSLAEAQLQALYDKKQELMTELRILEKSNTTMAANIKAASMPSTSSSSSNNNNGKNDSTSTIGSNTSLIPPTTKLSVQLKPNKQAQCLSLILSTNNDTLIKLGCIWNDILFDGNESFIVHPNTKALANTLVIPIKPTKNQASELVIKAIVGYRSSTQDHVFEMIHPLPKFSSFVSARPKDLVINSQVVFNTTERVNRVVLWINQAFLIDSTQPLNGSHFSVTSDSLHAGFISIRDNTPLIIRMTSENGGTLMIRTESMELAGDIIQDLCKYLKIEQLDTQADFPQEMEQFEQVLTRVEEYNTTRLKMSADIADSSNSVKTLIIKAEDSRILGEYKKMTKYYEMLYDLNRELLGEYTKRSNNHTELLSSLKEVNQMIQKAARLRMGEAKQRVVAACRVAIKANNTKAIMQLIKSGRPA